MKSILRIFFTIITPIALAVSTTHINNAYATEIIFPEKDQLEQLKADAQTFIDTGDILAAERTYFKAIELTKREQYLNGGPVWVDLARFYDKTAQYKKVIKVTYHKIRKNYPNLLFKIVKIHNRAVEILGPAAKGTPKIVRKSKEHENKYGHAGYKPQQSVNLVRGKTRRSEDDIYEKCVEEWKDDYRMVEYCVKKQTEGKVNVQRAPDNNIKENCIREWGTDHRMVAYCIKKQSAARDRLAKTR